MDSGREMGAIGQIGSADDTAVAAVLISFQFQPFDH